LKAPTNQPNADDPWKEPEEPYRVYSREEMQALLQTSSSKSKLTLPWGVVAGQILITALGALISCVFWDDGRISVYTYSAFLGGLIGVVPAVLFLLRLEIARGAQRLTAGGFLSALISGEVIKITATIAFIVTPSATGQPRSNR
jgi:ATP synthase protein I